MVWGAIAHGYKSQLVVVDGTLNAVRYIDEILTLHVIPAVQQRNFTYQQERNSHKLSQSLFFNPIY